jgi:hypothetical protein
MRTHGAFLTRSFLAFDDASRRRVRIFAVKLLIVVLFAGAFAAARGNPPLKTLAFFCGWQCLLSALTAWSQRQRCNADYLTAWDEMAAFLGVASLMRMVSVISG